MGARGGGGGHHKKGNMARTGVQRSGVPQPPKSEGIIETGGGGGGGGGAGPMPTTGDVRCVTKIIKHSGRKVSHNGNGTEIPISSFYLAEMSPKTKAYGISLNFTPMETRRGTRAHAAVVSFCLMGQLDTNIMFEA